MTVDAGQEDESPVRGRGGRAFTGVLAILGGTAIGQIVTLFALPVLARIYDPDEYGLLAVAMSAAAIIAPLATMRVEGAVVLAESRGEVSALIQAALVSLAASSTCLAAAIALSGLLPGGSIDGRTTLMWGLPLLVFVTGCMTLFSQLAVRDKVYSKIGTRNTAQSLAITAGQFGFAPLRGAPGFNGLIAGSVIGSAVGVLVLREYAAHYVRVVAWRASWAGLTRFWKFPAVFAPMASFTLLAQQGPVFVIAHRFSAAEVGQFAMADRVLAVPIALIGLAVGSVFEGEMADRLRRGTSDLSTVYLRTSVVLGAIGGLGGFVLWFLARPVSTWALGDEWSVAGEALAVMSIVLFSRMVVNPTRRFLQLLEKATLAFALEVLRVALFGCAVFIAATCAADLIDTLWWMLSALVVADVLTWVYGLHAVHSTDREAT